MATAYAYYSYLVCFCSTIWPNTNRIFDTALVILLCGFRKLNNGCSQYMDFVKTVGYVLCRQLAEK